MYENINIHIYNYIYTSLSEKVLDLSPLSRADINTDSLSPGVDFLFTVSMLSLLNSSINSSGWRRVRVRGDDDDGYKV
jgi:hypothetical protein